MGTLKVPYWKWRNGRPRWEPGGKGGARLRAAGFQGRDLKDETGAWLGMEPSIAAANKINAEVAQWRAGGRQRLAPPKPQRPERCCEALFQKYYESADFKLLAPKTRHDYKNKHSIFLAAGFADRHCRAITKPIALAYWQECYNKRGHAMANGIKAAVSAVFSYAELLGWCPENSNPWLKLQRPATPPRLALWLPAQLDALLEAADAPPAAGEAATLSIGDALILGLHTGQRLSDVLAMPDSLFDEERIALTQLKRKALIDVRMTPQVKERVAAIRRRRQAGAVVKLVAGELVRNEETGRRYTPKEFNTRWRAVRERAAKALPKVELDRRFAGGARVYELAQLNYQDLRDTCVTRLALAGCTMAEIAAITGHSLASITQIMKHYLALNRAMADAATDRVVGWLQQEGIAV